MTSHQDTQKVLKLITHLVWLSPLAFSTSYRRTDCICNMKRYCLKNTGLYIYCDHWVFPIKNDFTEARLNHQRPLLGIYGKKHRSFYGCWRKRSRPNKSDAPGEQGRNEEPVCCRLHQPGPCLTPRNGTTMSPLAPCHPAEAGFSSACGSYADSSVRPVSLWIGCGMVQSLGLLWIMKKSFLFLLSGLRVWWVDFFAFFFFLFVLFVYFFLPLCIAASGLHENCWVCKHFNK